MLSKNNLLEYAVKRNKAKSKRQSKKRVVMQRPLSIKPIERDYFKKITNILQDARKIIDEIFSLKLESIIKSRNSNLPKKDALHFDDWVDEIDQIFLGASYRLRLKYSEDDFLKISRDQANAINLFNKKNINDAFFKQYEIHAISPENWLQPEIKSFTKENVKLIKSIPDQYFDKIEKMVVRNVQKGALSSEIKQNILKEYSVSERRAALIARDQVNKFNGNLNELRQTDLGVKKYVWETSLDERVRPEHEARHGKTFSWKDPPPDGHPGEAINCRCIAIGVFEE